MPGTVGQGGTIRLEVNFRDGTGALVDPVTPLVDIINPSAVTLVTDAVPTRLSLGQYYYDYAVGGVAPLGTWTAHWTGVVNGVLVSGDDTFTVVAAGSISTTVGATLREIIDQTKSDWLYQGQREIVSRLTAAITTTTQVAITLTGVSPVAGMVLTIDYEDIYVITASGPTTVDVVRGWNGTEKATHLISTLVYHNARFPDWKILRAVNDELRSLSSPMNGLFRVRTTSFTAVAGQAGYDLVGAGADFLDVLSVELKDLTGSFVTTKRYGREYLPRVKRDMPLADYASGYALFPTRLWPSEHTVYVTYAATYGSVTSADLDLDIGDTTGIQASAQDILPVGAALRLIPGREVPRNDLAAKVTSRPSADVPPSAIARSADGLRILRATRINEERARLIGQYESYANVRTA